MILECYENWLNNSVFKGKAVFGTLYCFYNTYRKEIREVKRPLLLQWQTLQSAAVVELFLLLCLLEGFYEGINLCLHNWGYLECVLG